MKATLWAWLTDRAFVGGIVGALIAATASYLVWRLADRKTRPTKAAAYLYAIAGSLKGMASEFRNGEIPLEDGHQFEIQVRDYAPTLLVLGQSELVERVSRIEELLRKAKILDKGQFVRYGLDGEKRREWIEAAARLAGDLRGEADRLQAS